MMRGWIEGVWPVEGIVFFIFLVWLWRWWSCLRNSSFDSLMLKMLKVFVSLFMKALRFCSFSDLESSIFVWLLVFRLHFWMSCFGTFWVDGVFQVFFFVLTVFVFWDDFYSFYSGMPYFPSEVWYSSLLMRLAWMLKIGMWIHGNFISCLLVEIWSEHVILIILSVPCRSFSIWIAMHPVHVPLGAFVAHVVW